MTRLKTKRFKQYEKHCWIATHVYICRVTQTSADNWSPDMTERAVEMLTAMGFPPNEPHDNVRRRFVNLRKRGDAPSVINENMQRLIQI